MSDFQADELNGFLHYTPGCSKCRSNDNLVRPDHHSINNMLKIGLIDKYPVALKGMRVVVQEHFQEARLLSATSASNLKSVIGSDELDVLIIGYDQFSKSSWLSIVIEVRKFCPNVPIILIDESYQPGKIELYFKAGIMGNLLRRCPEEELVGAVRSVLIGKRYISHELHRSVLTESAYQDCDQVGTTVPARIRLGLTAREAEIAYYLTQGMQTKAIANLTKTTSSTISAIKRRVLKKMKSDNVIELARKMTAASI